MKLAGSARICKKIQNVIPYRTTYTCLRDVTLFPGPFLRPRRLHSKEGHVPHQGHVRAERPPLPHPLRLEEPPAVLHRRRRVHHVRQVLYRIYVQ